MTAISLWTGNFAEFFFLLLKDKAHTHTQLICIVICCFAFNISDSPNLANEQFAKIWTAFCAAEHKSALFFSSPSYSLNPMWIIGINRIEIYKQLDCIWIQNHLTKCKRHVRICIWMAYILRTTSNAIQSAARYLSIGLKLGIYSMCTIRFDVARFDFGKFPCATIRTRKHGDTQPFSYPIDTFNRIQRMLNGN